MNKLVSKDPIQELSNRRNGPYFIDPRYNNGGNNSVMGLLRRGYRKINGRWMSPEEQKKYYSEKRNFQQTSTSNEKPQSSVTQTNKYWWTKGYRNRIQGLGLDSRDKVIEYQKKLGVNPDGIWGGNTEKAFLESQRLSKMEKIPSLPIMKESSSVTPQQYSKSETAAPVKFFKYNYKTNNDYFSDPNGFREKLNKYKINSNSSLLGWLYNTSKFNDGDWNNLYGKDSTWLKQFRNDIDKILVGQYTDDSVKKILGTSGKWGKGFLGKGDYDDLYDTLQKYSNKWNFFHDFERDNYYNTGKYVDPEKIFKPLSEMGKYKEGEYSYYKKGGLISRNPVKRFKQKNISKINFN